LYQSSIFALALFVLQRLQAGIKLFLLLEPERNLGTM